MKRLAIAAIRTYRTAISPYTLGSCRYVPSCSEYAIEAIKEYGVFRGIVLSFWRILRCNPFSRGGYDPVKRPKTKNRKKSFLPRHSRINN